jgi:hypothetical protein
MIGKIVRMVVKVFLVIADAFNVVALGIFVVGWLGVFIALKAYVFAFFFALFVIWWHWPSRPKRRVDNR